MNLREHPPCSPAVKMLLSVLGSYTIDRQAKQFAMKALAEEDVYLVALYANKYPRDEILEDAAVVIEMRIRRDEVALEMVQGMLTSPFDDYVRQVAAKALRWFDLDGALKRFRLIARRETSAEVLSEFLEAEEEMDERVKNGGVAPRWHSILPRCQREITV